MSQIVIDSFTTCSERVEDITEPVYQRFFAASASGAGLMDHSDEFMKGRMLAQALELLMTESEDLDEGYLPWEIKNHVQAYSVELEMYPTFFAAIKDTVAEVLADDWDAKTATGWDAKIASLVADIRAVAAIEDPALA